MAKKDIAKHLNIQKLPKNRQEKMIKSLEDIIQRRISLAVYDLLTDEDKETLVQTTKKERLPFVKSRIPDLDNMLNSVASSAVDRFKIKAREVISGC